jgi:PAS domain S-box-containing protein
VHEFDPRIVGRLERQNAALISLARSDIFQSGDLRASLRRVVRAVSETLGVARVSVWEFQNSRASIRSLALFDARTSEVTEGAVLNAIDFPKYFRAIENSDLIDADDALQDPRTSEYGEPYLRPQGITSMLDVPVGGASGRWGILCHEHVGPARRWTGDERAFALAVANLVGAIVAHAQRTNVESRLRDYMDHASDCMTILSPEKKVVYANRTWHEIMGYGPADLAAGVSPWDFVHPSMRENLNNHFEQVSKGEEVRFDGLMLRTRDGREILIEGKAHPRMNQGRLEFIYVAWRDVTRQRQNERYRGYFADNSGGIYRMEARKPIPISLSVPDQVKWMAEHVYLAEANAAVCAIFGVKRPEELIGLPIPELFIDDGEFRRYAERWIRSGYRTDGVPVKVRSRDGRERSLLGSNHGMIVDGHVVRAWGMITDITARQKAETALRDSEERFRQIAENIREVFWLIDWPDRRIQYVSAAYETVFGLKAAALYVDPLDWLRVVHPDDRERVRSFTEQRSPDEPSGLLFRIIRPDGTVRWIQDHSYPVKNGDGAISRLAGIAEDITELKETEEALRESERRLSEALKRSEERVVQLEEQARDRHRLGRLVGKSPVMQEVYRRIRLAADSDATVLITGESGTGKELAASAIHTLGSRKDKPFVAINCSAIPETLLESELFGHMKGSFTGAVRDKSGLLAAAEGGTLFLDEVADMSPVLQVKLLRVLQEREYRRVGDERPMKCNVRIVTATNRDLGRLLATGALREDFYFRIRVFTIEMPPLEWRREDVPLLVGHIIEDLSRTTGRRVTGVVEEAMRALMDYPWPGNVRELRNALEGAFVTVRGERLTLEDLPLEVRRGASGGRVALSTEENGERSRIEEALKQAGGSRTRAAAALGVSRVTLWKKMRRLGIRE